MIMPSRVSVFIRGALLVGVMALLAERFDYAGQRLEECRRKEL
jgi:hypothetical protein